MKLTPRPPREVSLTVRIQKDNKAWLDAKAKETNRSRADIMDQILTEHRGGWTPKGRPNVAKKHSGKKVRTKKVG